MPVSDSQTRVCPTRIDHAPALFTHKVNEGTCQDRQRGRYHKCYTCAYNNAYVAARGLPEVATREPKPVVEVKEPRTVRVSELLPLRAI